MYTHYGKEIKVKYHESVVDFLETFTEYTILPVDVENVMVVRYPEGYAVIQRAGDIVLLLDELPEDGDYHVLMDDILGQIHGEKPIKMKSLFVKLFETAFADASYLIDRNYITEEDAEYYEKCKNKARNTVLEENKVDKEKQGFFYDDFRDRESYINKSTTELAEEKLQQKIAARLLKNKGWYESDMIFLSECADDLLGRELGMLHEGFYWYRF